MATHAMRAHARIFEETGMLISRAPLSIPCAQYTDLIAHTNRFARFFTLDCPAMADGH
jgi:hypothetical protein